ncbi:Alpha/Beta hydrolase protein [Mycena amicta]|nr:Alpha/Beta hydrolase protein [Mycena amicta]
MKILTVFSSFLGVVSATGPVVNLGYAKYEGAINLQNNVTTFLGVRYAAPPTGNLRWRAPTPPPSVQGTVQQATSQPPRCFQGALPANLTGNPVLAVRAIEDSEDCLFLNVYSPALTPKKLLPTIVWIHGGGYALGAASDYNGAELVLESNNNVVVVVIQYRLGLFGFLAGKQVHGDGSANAGLLDQDFALRWVNKNIHKFGGDPNKVAIWGQSAGAGSVIQHALAHNGKTEPKLFRAAITSSTFIPSQYPYDHWVPQTRFNQAAELAGCPSSTALDCLRTIDAGTLAEINLNVTLASYQGTFPFNPVVDGSFITKSPLVQLQEGKINGGVLLALTNTNEGDIFVSANVEYDVAEYARNLLPALSVPQSKSVAKVYSSLGSPLQQVRAIMTEVIFVCPSYYTLAAFPGKSYKGHFAIPPSLHGDDVSYYFPTFAAFGPPTPQFNNTDFISAFVGGFLSFAVNLDPNETLLPTIAPTWPKWSARAQEEFVFNETASADPEPAIGLQKVDEGLLERCEFWKALRIQTSQ